MFKKIMAGVLAVATMVISLPTVFATEKSTEGTLILYGDVDENGEVNRNDIYVLSDYLDGANIAINESNSDLDRNNVIDDFDMLWLIDYIAAKYNGYTENFDFDNMDEIKEVSQATIDLILENSMYLSDEDRIVIKRLIDRGYNKVKNPIITTAPITTEPITTTITTNVKPSYKLGDVNKDNKIDSKDATEILKAYAKKLLDGSKINLENADYNKDGKIDSKDASAILTAYAKELLNS